MEISRKTDYAMRMLAELVCNKDEIVSVRQAANNNGVPYSFARSIQHDLVRSGLVESIRGSHGGMRLAINPKETSILQIVEAIQGPVSVGECDTGQPDEKTCPSAYDRAFNVVWDEAERLLRECLDAVTLHQVVIEGCHPELLGPHEFAAVAGAAREA